MGAAIGWLQRNSSRSEEGRVLGPRSGLLQRTAASAFPVNVGCTTGSMCSGLSDAPTLMTGSP